MAVNFEKMLCGTLILCFLRAFGVGVKVGASVNSVSVVAVAVGVCWLLVFLSFVICGLLCCRVVAIVVAET